MIMLGSFDTNTTAAARAAYLEQVRTLTRVAMGDVVAGVDRIELTPLAPAGSTSMSVAQVQGALTRAGFFPGGVADGICGYRTQSAIRLFQEYVRAIERQDGVPDGRFGPGTQRHLQRWLDGGLQPDWTDAVAAWRSGTPAPGEYADWLVLLNAVKRHFSASPNRMLQLVAATTIRSDTRAVAEWDFGHAPMHLVGIRRAEKGNKFDDIFVLLIKGLVFKFQGSTEPGASTNPAGRPFLVQGQHDYHFGWHQRKYLALRPQGAGVLVVRSRNNDVLDDADLANGLEANATINIHWGGKGLKADVKSWSEGCQVINGSVYVGHRGELLNCGAFAAVNNGEVASTPSRTRGAFNVLVDLVTALGSDLPPTVLYTLLVESDLDLAPALKQGLASVRSQVISALG